MVMHLQATYINYNYNVYVIITIIVPLYANYVYVIVSKCYETAIYYPCILSVYIIRLYVKYSRTPLKGQLRYNGQAPGPK